MKLYTYFRSSSSYRVRIALNLKGIPYEPYFVHLRKGEQNLEHFRRFNPQGLVPVLVDGNDVLTQSLAIIEYLEENYPKPPLLPQDGPGRARVRALADIIACEMQPLNNLRVLNYLSSTLQQNEAECRNWYCHWIDEGFRAFESLLVSPKTGAFCHGESPTLADIFLVPQVFNAQRYRCDLNTYPTVQRIHATCVALPAFRSAAPENQPDCESL